MGLQSTQGYRGKLVDKLTGIILDQFADEDIKVSNNILDLFDLGEIPGTYTQTITLPGTKKNNAFFEQYYDISVYDPDIFNTNQVVEAYLDFDGFYLVNGYLQLNKVNVIQNKFVDSYEVTLFGIISNFSIDTRASFLTDLSSLSVYNHTSSLANITSSWGGGLFNGDIVYPMAEYGNDATDLPNFYYSQIDFLGIDDYESGVTVSNYKPAIRIKKVWDAIFNQFGYTYTGSFWEQGWLDNVYMPLNNNKEVPVYNSPIDTYYQCRLTNVSASALTLASGSKYAFPANSKVYDYDGAAVLGGGSFTFTSPITSRYDVKLDLAFQVVSGAFGAGSGMPAWYIDYVTGSTTINTQVLARLNTQMTTIANSRTQVVTETFNVKDYLFTLPTLPPGTYTFKIYYAPINTNNFQVKLNPDSQNQCAWEIYKCRQAADYKILDVPANMPFGTSGIRVIDFIRSIQKKFNLIIYPDKQNPNQFIVETFNNWYKQGTIKDFNKYINLLDKVSYTPANQLGYRKVRFSDGEDTDYVTTLFKRTNNRVYGESNFYDSGSYYSQGTLDVVADVIGNGPLALVPGSVYTGSVATAASCTTFEAYNPSGYITQNIAWIQCDGASGSYDILPGFTYNFCAQSDSPITIQYEDGANPLTWANIGDCTPTPSSPTGSGYPMWIPYYIADDKYTPARVEPRLYFYNGLRDTQKYWFEGYLYSTSSVSSLSFTQYPYFDNYSTGSLNGTASLYPQLDARSLLFNNEQAVWGTTPTANLVSEYWATYLGLLYNPRTRLVEASAVIGLADYFNLELNDIAEFRGNYYHLRAINDYNLTTGECTVQMLGPIISDTISSILSGSWAPVNDLCAFDYTASLVPMWSGSGVNYGLYLNGSTDFDINELPNGQISIAGNFGNYNLAITSSSPYNDDLILVDATGSLIRSASGALETELYGGPSRAAILSNDYLLVTYAATPPNQTGSILMASSSLSEYDTTFMTNRGTGFRVAGSEETVPSILGNVNKHYIWVQNSERYGSTTFATGSIVRIHTNPTASNRGSLDTSWILPTTGSNNGIDVAGVQSDGKVVLAGIGRTGAMNVLWAPTGSVTGSYTVYGLARLNSDGTYDPTFVTASQQAFTNSAWPLVPNGLSVQDMAIDSQDNIYIVGRFDKWQKTTSANCIVKLNSSGTLDTTFMTNIGTGPSTVGAPYAAAQSQSQALYAIAIEPGTDKVVVGGAFRSWNGTNVQGITRLNSDGTLDTTFIPNTVPTGGLGLPLGAVASQKGTFGSAGYGGMDITFAANGDILVYGSFNNSGTDGNGTGSAATITNMTWNNVSASFGSEGYMPARLLRITDSGSFPVNGSYII